MVQLILVVLEVRVVLVGLAFLGIPLVQYLRPVPLLRSIP